MSKVKNAKPQVINKAKTGIQIPTKQTAIKSKFNEPKNNQTKNVMSKTEIQKQPVKKELPKEQPKNVTPQTTLTAEVKKLSPLATTTVLRDNYLMVSPSLIIADENLNPRFEYGDIEELMNSILENGIRNPLTHIAVFSFEFVANQGV